MENEHEIEMSETLQKEIETQLNESHEDNDKITSITASTDQTTEPKKNETTILQSKRGSLEKLMSLLENNDIDEDQLRDIIRHMKEEGMHITWNSCHEKILKSIGEKSSIYHEMHRTCHFYYKKEHAWFAMPMFILSLAASFGNFASYKWIDDNSNLDVVKYAGIITGIMNLIIAVLQKMMEFRQPEYLSIEHKNAAHIYQNIYNEISIQLSLPRDEREPMPQYLTEIVKRYSESLKISPEINPKILSKARTYLKDEVTYKDGMAVPEIVIGPAPIAVYKKYKKRKHNDISDDENMDESKD
tara:strand:- start:449 stop:1351 length:903 start_codon:yes stop_codon:yes gene_type:complete